MLRPSISWALTLAPSIPLLCIYLAFLKVLAAKKAEMRMLLERGESLSKYLAAYGKRRSSQDVTTAIEADRTRERIIARIFALQYSRWEYAPAIIFCVLVTSAISALALAFFGLDLGLPPELHQAIVGTRYFKNVVAGGLGALVWAIYDLSERYKKGGLAPDTFFNLGSRVLIVSSVGAFIGTIAVGRSTLGWPIAFAIGVLPIKAIQKFLEDRVAGKLNISSSSPTPDHPALHLLQGWTAETSERLNRAGVSSVEQLACMDPFQTLVRSNLEWRVILDLCDQALLLIYVGDGIHPLRKLGIRTAVELAVIGWEIDSPNYHLQMTHEDAFERIANALKMHVQDTKLLVRSISDDATVSFLSSLWAEDNPSDDDGDHNESEDDGKSLVETGSAITPV